ncbi:hypothetical protein [Corynebacterium auriscanis]|nr:hypothetical protein [Corynebacterium auriscanis]WJY72983.1 hypothetical protein CAURIC_06810 [Corynebacterium auriscanis]
MTLDTEGTYWIVEGKADDETVICGREATECLLRSLIAHPAYQYQTWTYLIAFESDIRKSDSFAEPASLGGVKRTLPS